MAEQEEVPARELELLKLEYQECVTGGRFIGGIRFTFFASFMAFFFALIGSYHFVWAASEERFGALKP